MTTAPAPGRRAPKKTGVHAAFSPSCSHQSARAGRRLGSVDLSTRRAEYAICAYSTVQTGPKARDGGVQLGLRRLGYHVATERRVAAAPPTAASATAVAYPNVRTPGPYAFASDHQLCWAPIRRFAVVFAS
jgi:hypothetical protein